MANQGYWTANLQLTKDRANAMLVQAGTDSAKGDAGLAGRLYFATDTGAVYRDSGSAWVSLLASDAATGTPSRRTLGTGSTQASTGNHTHT